MTTTATNAFENQLQTYADLAIRVGLNLQPGQILIIRAPIKTAPLVRLVAISGYQAGAKHVEIVWHDDALKLARFEHAPRDTFEFFPTWQFESLKAMLDDGGALLTIKAQDPDLLKDQDSDLVALVEQVQRTHMKPVIDLIMNNAFNWLVMAAPIDSWAAKIFPDDSSESRIAKLWQLIFQACRVNEPNPIAAWQQHAQDLATRKAYLNDKQYTALHYLAPGTDLTIGLPRQHIWNGVEAKTLADLTFIPNLPTEEIFTLPHREVADGVISSTRPLSHAGVLITDFSLTFEAGRVVNASAKTGEAVLKKLLDADEGAARLGEIALLPHSSPISQTGTLFYNTLFDENAACHLALGGAYPFCLTDGSRMSSDQFLAAGGNNSAVHTDFMVGSDELNIDGLTADGSTEPILRQGEWAF